MRPDRELRFRLEGGAEDGGAVRLDAVQALVEAVEEVLAAVECDITRQDRASTHARVTHLSLSSPMELGVTPVGPMADPSIGPTVAREARRDLALVQAGQRPERASTRTLQACAALVTPYQHGVETLGIYGEDLAEVVPLRRDLPSAVAELLGVPQYTHGTWRGRLDAVNFHSPLRVLYIYPTAGPTRIRCTYRGSRLDDMAVRLARQFVEVEGRLRFRVGDPFPEEILVAELRPVPQEGLPTVDDLVGSLPEITGGMEIGDYLHMLRDE
ncbi:MAG: hypothetical protein HYU66_23120 [Armatimonadetes bacterium]|nr:hypothetical protein [Armatimonadota bacterium]